MFDLTALQAKIKEFADKGFTQEVNAACRYAQRETRAFIARTHPTHAFGHTIDKKQFIIGRFDIESDKVISGIYANYFARWYNTGMYGRIKVNAERKPGEEPEREKRIEPRGQYFENNAKAITEYFAKAVDRYLDRELEEWL